MIRRMHLWFICCAGVLLLFAVAAEAAVDKVICVPWQGNTAKYHTTWSGYNVYLKGVIKTDNTAQIWYKWNYGDGTSSPVYSTSGKTKYNVEIRHPYTGADGTPFTAQLLVDAVDNSMANAVADSYLVKIEPYNLDAKINVAIDNGLWYLYKSGSNASGYYHTYDGSPIMVWSYSSYFACPTASAVHAFQINGHKETGNFDEDPYAEYVEGGLNWLFQGYYYNTTYPMLRAYNIGVVHGSDDPEEGQVAPHRNSKGIEVRDSAYRPVYESGIVADAIIASGTPDADCGRDFDGDGSTDTYREVVQDMVDQIAWGQCDSYNASYGGYIGGWRYNWNDWPDNSACQWAAISMIPAQEAPWNCTVPQWVKTYNNNWLNYSFYQWNWDGTQYLWGGFGYTSASWGDALTPSGMVQLAFAGIPTSDHRWVKCERWFADGWKDRERDWLDRNIVYGYYSFAKAMRLAKPNPVVNFSAGYFAGLDWYRGGSVGGATVMGMAEKISDRLVASSYWDYYGPVLGTSWCVIILKPVLFAEAPVACFDADPNPSYPDQPVNFDPSCSGHSEAGKDIGNLVLFEWDWTSDGTYDQSTTTPTVVTHAFPCASIPCQYTTTLRVTDDSVPPRTATYAMNIDITNPPHPPVARSKDIYLVSLCEGDTLVLDASDSYDPDEGEHEAGCPTCPDDTITKYEWDLDGAPFDYTGPTGEFVNLGTGFTTYFPTAGVYNIGIKVTDNTALAYPGSGEPNLTDEGFAEVRVYNGCLCDVSATPMCLAVMLQWDDIGADMYYIYRSFAGPHTGFQDIGRTDGTMKIAGSFVMDLPHWYRIMAEKDGVFCLSKAVEVVGAASLCNPTADAGGPYEACLGDTITLDGSGSSAHPSAGTLITWEWDLDNDGEYDDAFGETVQHTWTTPGSYAVGLQVTSSDSLVLTDTDTATVTVNQCACADNLAARAKDGKIQLTWDAQAGADSYNVYRSTAQGGPYSLAANVVTTYCTYLDSGLTNGTTYYYVVRPVSGGDEICQSEEVSATPVAARTRR